jgi:hypothetical protein
MRQEYNVGKKKTTRIRLRTAVISVAAMIAGPALGADQTNTSGSGTQNGQNNAVTISLSGSTAMRNFTISPGFTYLTPGSTIMLGNGPGGAPVSYSAPLGGGTQVQLAGGDFGTADSPQPLSLGTTSGASIQNHSAVRLEWHEQGSVEGILEMVNDQVGYAGGAGGNPLLGTPLIDPSLRNPTVNGGNAFSNPVWVNRNKFDATGLQNFVGNTVGAGNATTRFHGFVLNNSDYNTYNFANPTFNPTPGANGYTYNMATGSNLQGGTNRVQMAISDVNHVQGFSVGGNSAAGFISATPQTTGYGKGNTTAGLNVMPNSLPTNALVTPGSAFQLRDSGALNMPTTNIDPQTGTNYAAGAWNTAGVGNLVSQRVAVTATTFAANPGTGLTKLNSTDAQWLQTTGRLQNGADFNVASRDVNSGTRNVAALNTGIDPSFAVGKNDAGNGYVNLIGSGIDSQSQLQIGGSTNSAGVPVSGGLTAPLFSNKSAGGQLRSVVQNSRMGIGTLGMSDAIGTAKNGTATPIRVLAYADTAGQGAGAGYVLPSASSITDGTYVIYQNEQYITIQAPNANYGTANFNIKGDNANHDVATVKNNILNAVTQFPATSIANPADQLLATSFILPQMMAVEKNVDGINQSTANPGYSASLRTAFLGSSYAANFNPADPSTVTNGSSSFYGAAGTNVQNMAKSEQILITPQNYVFGNFNQNGVRDYSAIQTGLTAAKTLYNNAVTLDAAHGTGMFTGDSNATQITNAGLPGPLGGMLGQRGSASAQAAGASKGDLIVLGDYNGDGRFNGADIYSMARGAALADAAGGTTLTSASGATFGDQVRNGVLVKNAALDYMQTNTTDATYDGAGNPTNASAFLRQTASRNTANDPRGLNAFNRYDVNSDGLVTRNDAAIIDRFYGKSFTNMADQISATINVNGTLAAGVQKPISLVDVQQIDGASAIGRADLNQFLTTNPGLVNPADANFDGKVDFLDFGNLSTHFGQHTSQFSAGDFNGDGVVDFLDFGVLSTNFGSMSPAQAAGVVAWGQTLAANPAEVAIVDGFATAHTAVPEPGTLGLIAAGAFGLLVRRRRTATENR